MENRRTRRERGEIGKGKREGEAHPRTHNTTEKNMWQSGKLRLRVRQARAHQSPKPKYTGKKTETNVILNIKDGLERRVCNEVSGPLIAHHVAPSPAVGLRTVLVDKRAVGPCARNQHYTSLVTHGEDGAIGVCDNLHRLGVRRIPLHQPFFDPTPCINVVGTAEGHVLSRVSTHTDTARHTKRNDVRVSC